MNKTLFPKAFPAPAESNTGRVFVARSWLEGSASCTVFTTLLMSFTERFTWRGNVHWWVYAGEGERPELAQGAAEVTDDWDYENRWWMLFSGQQPGGEEAMQRYLEAQERLHVMPLFKTAPGVAHL